jgi:molybdopterin converting factor small subunit
MQLEIKLFGQLAHLADRETLQQECAPGTPLPEVLRAAASQYDEAFLNILFDDTGALRAAVMVLVNDAPIDKAAPPAVAEGDTVTLIPAISGG